MKEIGGYLEFAELKGQAYYENAIALNTARNALVYLVRAKNIKKMYLPYYLCDSVSKVCDREKIEYEFYHTEGFLPTFDKDLDEGEYLYLVNHFGQLKECVVDEYKSRYKNVILDNVQAFFTKPRKGVDTIYSCRKFFGVSDGAYLCSDCKRLDITTDSSRERLTHLLGRYEGSASEYYREFQKNDEKFEYLELAEMSRFTRNILKAIDYDVIIKQRENNWDFLDKKFKNINKISPNKPCGPYMYPLRVENGESIRKALAESKIYIPTLWPNVFQFDGCLDEKNFVKNVLALPIDQRYNEADMQIIVDKISELI